MTGSIAAIATPAVETGADAGLPPTHTCMTCHSQIWTDAPMLAPVRESYATGKPLRVEPRRPAARLRLFRPPRPRRHGVACVECHGRVDKMPLTWRAQAFTMNSASIATETRRRLCARRDMVTRMDWPAARRETRRSGRAQGLIANLTNCETATDERPPACPSASRARLLARSRQMIDQPDFRASAGAVPGARPLRSAARLPQMLAATMALAGLDGCERRADETASRPWSTPDGGPGVERHYATAVELDGIGQPVIGICRDGRPVKLEGNPRPSGERRRDRRVHPGRLARAVRSRPLADAAAARPGGDVGRVRRCRATARGHSTVRPARASTATGRSARRPCCARSPNCATRWPEMRLARSTRRAPARFAAPPILPLDKPSLCRARRRSARPRAAPDDPRARLVGAGGGRIRPGRATRCCSWRSRCPTLTGAVAGERLTARHGRIGRVAGGAGNRARRPASGETFDTRELGWLQTAAAALLAQKGARVVALGRASSAGAARAGCGDQRQAGRARAARLQRRPIRMPKGSIAWHRRCARAKRAACSCSTAIPLTPRPPISGFAAAFRKVPLRIHAGLHADETAELCALALAAGPLARELERRARRRTARRRSSSRWCGRSTTCASRHEVLALLAGDTQRSRALVQKSWNASDVDPRWQRAAAAVDRAVCAMRETARRAGVRRSGGSPPPLPRPALARKGERLSRPRSRHPPDPSSTTASSRTIPGCRSCPSRSPS